MYLLRVTHADAHRSWVGIVALFLGLNLLLRVPDVLAGRFPMEGSFYLSDPTRLYYFFSLDLFCLLSLLVLIPIRRAKGWHYFAVTAALLFLLAYRTYDAVVAVFLHRSAIAYADASHVVGAFYLFLNAGLSWLHVVGGVAVGSAVGALTWALPSLLRSAHRGARQLELRRGLLATHLILWPLLGVAAATDQGIERETYQEVCLATVQCIAYNVEASLDLQRTTARRRTKAVDSTYVDYRSLGWDRRPSVYLVMIESYGAVLADKPLGPAYAELTSRAGDSLRASGWHMATAKSTSPIVGGLSWLSAATVLTGTPIGHQPAYEMLKADLDRYPHLVNLFGKMGYRTGVLQPPVRARPGLRVGNPYDFDRTFFFDDLDYRGPSYGWGIVPDQYSLAVAHEAFVEDQPDPFFLFAETVTSHAQWRALPPPVSETAQALNRPTSNVPAVGAHDGALGRGTRPADPDTLSQAERFFRYVEYEWRVLVEYLRTNAPPNSLVLVLGDHQPYFADGESSATPLHVLSRRSTLVQQFEQYGLRSGLQLGLASDTLHHAGLYSLLVRVLTANDRGPKAGTDRLPPYRARGVQRSALLDAPS